MIGAHVGRGESERRGEKAAFFYLQNEDQRKALFEFMLSLRNKENS